MIPRRMFSAPGRKRTLLPMSALAEPMVPAPARGPAGLEIVPPKLARALERERADLVMSLRALAAVLKEGGGDPHEEAIFARMLDAQIVQLAILSADLIAALQLEDCEFGSPVAVSLPAALESALAASAGRPVVVGDIQSVSVMGHPQVVVRLLQSSLAMAHRVAERSPTVSVRAHTTSGAVVFEIPTGERGFPRSLWNARFRLLHRITRAEGGRMRTRHSMHGVTLTLALQRA